MSITGFLRGAARGAASVGRAVQTASRKLDEVVAGQAPPQAAQVQPEVPVQGQGADGQSGALPQPAQTIPEQEAEQKPRGFSLPSLGNAPLREDPKYANEDGEKRYAEDLEQYEHKLDIHEAFQELDRIYSEAHPGRDYQKEYEEESAARKKHEASLPRGNSLARFALALGDQNPVLQDAGKSNLKDYDARIQGERDASEDSFSKRMTLRRQAYEKQAAEAEAKGNFKQALAAQEQLALLKADSDQLEHKRTMEKTAAQQQGASDRARIRADAMKRTAEIRARTVADAHDLSGTFLKEFEKEAAKAVSRFLGPQDMTKDYDPRDLDALTDYIEHLAEFFHDKEHGEGSSEKYLNTSPKKRAKPKPPATEKPDF